jgi:hypothetical protein
MRLEDFAELIEACVIDPFCGETSCEAFEDFADLIELLKVHEVHAVDLGTAMGNIYRQPVVDETLHRLADWAAAHLQAPRELRHAERGAGRELV